MAAPIPVPFNTAAALLFAAATVLVFHACLSSASADLTTDPNMAGFVTLGLYPEHASSSRSECRGSISECSVVGGEEDEFVMDSEINRRMLAVARYISYGALRRNVVPCSRRGVSYYNCHVGAPANPYVRGCSRIARCRG